MQRSKVLSKYRFLLVLTLPVVVMLYLLAAVSPAALAATRVRQDNGVAQEDGLQSAETWDPAINLSKSGGATDPVMVGDDANILHVFWQDEYAGSTYTSGSGDNWSRPVTVTVPFSGTRPLLLAGANGAVFAAWSGEENELFFSRARFAELDQQAAWSPEQQLEASVLDYDAVTDEAGDIHLVYVRVADSAGYPAGIYYRRSGDAGETWTAPQALFTSPYVRSMRQQDAHVTIKAVHDGDNLWLYAGWDMRSRKRIYFVGSADGGQSWNEPLEVVGPESTSSIVLPFNIQIGATGSEVLLAWQTGQPGVACEQFYQWSTDHGENWEQRQRMAELTPGFQSCGSTTTLFSGNGLHFLLTTLQASAFLHAWNGERWSNPQRQDPVARFNDPQTLNTVALDCRQALTIDDASLYIVGCDLTESSAGGGDIWLIRRDLDTSQAWFPTAAEWSQPDDIATAPVAFNSLTSVSGGPDAIHAFWTQAEADGQAGTDIYYSDWNGESWPLPSVILTSPNAVAGPLKVLANQNGRIFVAWTTRAGELFVSHGMAGALQVATNWAPIQPVPIPAAGVTMPDIAISADGTLYVSYAAPINDRRGIYVLSSDDNGVTWDEDGRVFDAAGAGWEMVGAPQMAIANDGSIHFVVSENMWTQQAGTTPTRLYHIACAADLASCDPPRGLADGQSGWADIVTSPDGRLHLAWQLVHEGESLFEHQSSADNGQSWGDVHTIFSASEAATVQSARLVAGNQSEAYFFALVDNVLRHWSLQDSAIWVPDEKFTRSLAPDVARDIGATITPSGQLAVLFGDRDITSALGPEGEESVVALNFVHKLAATEDGVVEENVIEPSVTAQAPPAVEATVVPVAVSEDTVEAPATAEPTIVAQFEDRGTPILQTQNPLVPLIASLLPVVLLVALILLAVFVMRRRSLRQGR